MSGLRERKKQQNQKNIIEAAKGIFSEKGFQQASMAEIAKNAKVGIGTIYNYFSSKGAILLAILFEDLEQIQQDNQIVITEDRGDLVEEIMQLMQTLTVFFDHYTKAFWRELMHIITAEVEESVQLRRGMFGLDEEAMQWIKQLIDKHSDCFLVPVNAEAAAFTIYSTAITQTMIFIYDDMFTYEQFLDGLKQQIQFIFSGKMKS